MVFEPGGGRPNPTIEPARPVAQWSTPPDTYAWGLDSNPTDGTAPERATLLQPSSACKHAAMGTRTTTPASVVPNSSPTVVG